MKTKDLRASEISSLMYKRIEAFYEVNYKHLYVEKRKPIVEKTSEWQKKKPKKFKGKL
jgi:hypothetical protein